MSRLREYLTEDGNMDVIETIKRDCKPFLYESDGLLYRGVEQNIKHILKKTARLTDRKPMNMDKELHELFNALFIERFGWPVRNGVFAVGDSIHAYRWPGCDSPYIFFPIGRYKYVWSRSVKDLYIEYDDSDWDDKRSLEQKQSVVDQYIDTNLDEARHMGRHEISFKCNEYYLINMIYENDLKRLL